MVKSFCLGRPLGTVGRDLDPTAERPLRRPLGRPLRRPLGRVGRNLDPTAERPLGRVVRGRT
jgi:hypothetical protein